MAADVAVHAEITLQLARLDQRYTKVRRALVEVLAESKRPLTMPEIAKLAPALPQSSIYRNLAVLSEVGIVQRVAGIEDHTRFELDEGLSGHHHHLICAQCGRVEDVSASPRLERAIGEAARAIAGEHDFAITEHQLDLKGICSRCHTA